VRLLVVIVILAASALGQTQTLAAAIAKAEGFYQVGSLPRRLHNPGDLKGCCYFRQVGNAKGGWAKFRNDADGWAALNRQLEKIVLGESRCYSVNMTLREMGRKYAGSRRWSDNISHNLGVTPETALFEILNVPPVVEIPIEPMKLTL